MSKIIFEASCRKGRGREINLMTFSNWTFVEEESLNVCLGALQVDASIFTGGENDYMFDFQYHAQLSGNLALDRFFQSTNLYDLMFVSTPLLMTMKGKLYTHTHAHINFSSKHVSHTRSILITRKLQRLFYQVILLATLVPINICCILAHIVVLMCSSKPWILLGF